MSVSFDIYNHYGYLSHENGVYHQEDRNISVIFKLSMIIMVKGEFKIWCHYKLRLQRIKQWYKHFMALVVINYKISPGKRRNIDYDTILNWFFIILEVSGTGMMSI